MSEKWALRLRAAGVGFVSLSVLVLASACSAVQAEDQLYLPDVDEQQSPPPQQSETPEDSQNPTEPEIETVDCSQVIQSGIETTINAQTASFAVGDYELAYSYASPSFQGSVSISRFIDIIEGSYGPLISSTTLSFENCLYYSEPELATINVRFTEAGVTLYALRYLMVETDFGWRVDGASALEEIGQAT